MISPDVLLPAREDPVDFFRQLQEARMVARYAPNQFCHFIEGTAIHGIHVILHDTVMTHVSTRTTGSGNRAASGH